LGGPQNQSGRQGDMEIPDTSGTRTPTSRSSNPQPVVIPTALGDGYRHLCYGVIKSGIKLTVFSVSRGSSLYGTKFGGGGGEEWPLRQIPGSARGRLRQINTCTRVQELRQSVQTATVNTASGPTADAHILTWLLPMRVLIPITEHRSKVSFVPTSV
jgi:hypothetical protein